MSVGQRASLSVKTVILVLIRYCLVLRETLLELTEVRLLPTHKGVLARLNIAHILINAIRF
jgi:hypothetical protein